MRLLVCLIASVVIHAAFFELGSVRLSAPTLSISLEPKNLDLQIRNQSKKKEEITPRPPKKTPQPTPPPIQKKKVVPKKPSKKLEPRPTPEKRQPEKEIEPPSEEPKQKEYFSAVQEKPRLIERAEYLSNPPPEYPDQARRRKQDGTVTLRVEIDSNGSVTTLRIQQSSGFLILDQAAEKAVAKWRFTPATIGARKVASKVIVPVLFKLNR